MRKKLLTLCLSLIIGYSFHSTAQTLNRVEIEAKKVADDYSIIPVGKEGIIMFYESKERAKGGNKVWVFSKYDTDFKEVWTKEYPIEKRLDYIDFDLNAGKLYLFLGKSQGQTAKNSDGSTAHSSGLTNNKGDFEIVTIDYKSGTIKNTPGTIPFKADVSQNFSVIKDHAFISGKTMAGTSDACLQMLLTCTCIPWITQFTVFKFKPVIIDLDLNTGTSKLIPTTEYKGNSFVMEAGKSYDGSNMDFIIKNKPSYQEQTNFFIKRYSEKGDETKKTAIKGDIKDELVTSRVLNISEKEQILIGTYKKANPPRKYFNPANDKAMSISTEAEGLFFSKIDGGKQKYIKYYTFKDFKRFYDLVTKYGVRKLSERQQDRLNKKMEDENYALKYHLLVHNIIVKNDQYIMVAEAYYPEYHTERRSVIGPNGQYTMQWVTVFDGFRFTHAIVAGFDKDGNKLWDNSFEIEDILSQKLTERVRILPGDNETALVYAYRGSIISKVIKGSEVIDGKTATKIDTGKDKDKVRSSEDSKIDYWYDNYFVSYGYQKIKNTGGKTNEEKRRRVYYFNKISYQ